MLSPFFNLLVQNGDFATDPVGGEINGTYIGVDENGSTTLSNGTRSYTISGSFVSTDTIVIVTSNMSTTGDNNSITTATINSQSATAAVTHQDATSSRFSQGIFYITGISGSSLSVAVSYTGTDVARSVCYAYKLDSANVTVAETDTGDGSDQTLSYDVSGETFGVCIFTDNGGTVSISTASGWTQNASVTTDSFLRTAVGSKEDVGTGSVSTTTTTTPRGGVLAIFQRTDGDPGTSLGFQDAVASGTPSIVGSTSTSGSTSIDLTQITGLQEGDLVIVWVTDDSTPVNIESSGWTVLNDGARRSINYSVARKVMGATPDTSFSIDPSANALSAIALRDVEFDAISSSPANDRNVSSFTPDSISVSKDDAITLILAALDDDNSTISTPSTGYTVQTEDGETGGSNAIMAKTGVSAGTESPGQYVWNSTDNQISFTLSFVRSGPDPRNSTALRDIA